jgi:hypothetical protein
MKAECYGSANPDIPIFIIPQKYYADILGTLSNLKVDSAPDIDQEEMGTIRIVRREGQSIRVCWYRNANGGGVSWNGVRARIKESDDGGSTILDPIVRGIAAKEGE